MKASQPGRWVNRGQHMQPSGNQEHNARASRRRGVLPGCLVFPLLEDSLHKTCLHCLFRHQAFPGPVGWPGPVLRIALRSSSPGSPRRWAHVSGRTHRKPSLSRISLILPMSTWSIGPYTTQCPAPGLPYRCPIPSVLVCPSALPPPSPGASV